MVRVLEGHHQGDGREHEGPVHRGHVDLPDLLPGRVLDEHARAEPELDGLARQGKRSGDDGLGRDDGRGGGQSDQGVDRPRGRQPEEGVLLSRGIQEEHGALPEVVQEEAGEDEDEPGEPDGPLAEVAHVRVEGLAARLHEKDGPQGEEGVQPVLEEEVERVNRVQPGEDPGLLEDAVEPQPADDEEPHGHDGAEEGPDPRRPPALEEEQGDEEDHGDGHHVGLEEGRGDLQPLHRAHDRDGGRDDAVPVEEGGAEEAEDDEADGLPAVSRRAGPGP